MTPKILLLCAPASLLKQLIAMVYDSLLIASVLFLATAILLPFNQGEAITGPVYSAYLVLVVFIFYSWFWHKSGQTLGMKVWKIRIIDQYGYKPSWPISFLRLFCAIIPPTIFIILNAYFGWVQEHRTTAMFAAGFFILGYLPRLFTPYTWHDRLSQTQIIDLTKCPEEEK